MRKLVIAILYGTVSMVSFGQIKTLERILTQRDDTTKVNDLNNYARDIMSTDTARSKQLLNSALYLAERLRFNDGIGTSLLNLAKLLSNSGNYPASLYYYSKAKEYFGLTRNFKRVAGCEMGLGSIYCYQNKMDSAVYYFLDAAKISKENNYPDEVNNAYHYLGIFYNNIEVYDKAVQYLKMALDFCEKNHDSAGICSNLYGLSLAYMNLNNERQAFGYASKALTIARTLNDNWQLCYALDMYASACVGVGKMAEALAAARQAVDVANACGFVQIYLSASHTLATSYLKIKQYNKAIAILEKTVNKGKETNDKMYLNEIYDALGTAYYKAGHFKAAYENAIQSRAYHDTLTNEETTRRIAELNIKYETTEKEKEISQKQLQLTQKDLELQKNRYYMYYTFGALLVALLILVMLYFKSRYKRLAHAKELRSLQQQKELQLLHAIMQGEEKERSRIAKDLHDGVAGMLAAVKMHFSSIPFVDNLQQTEGYQQGMHLLNEATQEIRKTSHNLMPEILLQQGLDEALRRYCNNVNNSKSLQIQYDSWGEVDRFADGFELSVYRIVQELLNNIIKHSKATHAFVQLTQQGDLLSISIEDNGVGFTKDSGSSEGIGLSNLKNRVKAMNGKMEMQASEQSGVSAYLEFEISELKK